MSPWYERSVRVHIHVSTQFSSQKKHINVTHIQSIQIVFGDTKSDFRLPAPTRMMVTGYDAE